MRAPVHVRPTAALLVALLGCSSTPATTPSPTDSGAGTDGTDVSTDVVSTDVVSTDVVSADVTADALSSADAAMDGSVAPDVSEGDGTSIDAPAGDVTDAAMDLDADAGAAPDAPVRTDAPVATDVPATPDAADSGVALPFDWTGIVGTGQSLSVGARGTPAISTTQPYANLKLLDTGAPPLYDGVGDRLSLTPLVEPIRPHLAGYTTSAYPDNIAGESPHTAMSAEVSALAMAALGHDRVTLHSVVGQGGQSITVIQRGGTGNAFASSLYEARAFHTLAMTAGHTFGYGAVVLTHGEADSARATYEADIYRLFTDYNTQLRAITGQTTVIPLLLSQQSTEPGAPGVRSVSTLAAWRLGVDHPGELVCIGPKYQYAYASDHLHLDAHGYRRLGIKYGEVYFETVVLGHPWHPLQPRAVHRTDGILTVDFEVPVGPLAWEDTLAPPHQTALPQWAHGRGFEVSDASGPLAIESVALAGNSVVITLSAVPAPTDTGLVVRYAMTQDGTGTQGGLPTGRSGQLRDSDPLVGFDRETVRCAVTHGSATVTSATPTGFAARGVRDLVDGSGLTADATVLAAPTATTFTLSAPWTGPTGAVELTFHSDQRNYCVQFELPVP